MFVHVQSLANLGINESAIQDIIKEVDKVRRGVVMVLGRAAGSRTPQRGQRRGRGDRRRGSGLDLECNGEGINSRTRIRLIFRCSDPNRLTWALLRWLATCRMGTARSTTMR